MQNSSTFVKVVIWLMVFLMSVGFVALIITPFAGNSSLFGSGSDPRSATLDLLEEARSDVKKDDCANTEKPPTGKRLARCKVAVEDLGAAYQTLTIPETPDDPKVQPEQPKDYKDNVRKATESFQLLLALDPKDRDSIQRLAGFYRDQGKAAEALPLWSSLVKRYPDSNEYLLQLGQAQHGAGKTEEAKATYRLFIKRFPERESDVEGVQGLLDQMAEQEQAQAAGAGGAAPINIG